MYTSTLFYHLLACVGVSAWHPPNVLEGSDELEGGLWKEVNLEFSFMSSSADGNFASNSSAATPLWPRASPPHLVALASCRDALVVDKELEICVMQLLEWYCGEEGSGCDESDNVAKCYRPRVEGASPPSLGDEGRGTSQDSVAAGCVTCSREAQLLHHVFALRNTMDEHLAEHPQTDRRYEGDITSFPAKVFLLQELAALPQVKTICEVGFNMGRSALSYLTADPSVHVLSFDLGSWWYSQVANRYIQSSFPYADFNLVLGDSELSIPSLVRQMKRTLQIGPGEERSEQSESLGMCDMIFVDGGHSYSTALADIVNFKDLASKDWHVLVVDDLYFDVKRAWEDVLGLGLVLASPPLEVQAILGGPGVTHSSLMQDGRVGVGVYVAASAHGLSTSKDGAELLLRSRMK